MYHIIRSIQKMRKEVNLVAVINLRNIPDKLHRQIKAEAALQGMTLRDFVVKVLEEYLKKAKKKRT